MEDLKRQRECERILKLDRAHDGEPDAPRTDAPPPVDVLFDHLFDRPPREQQPDTHPRRLPRRNRYRRTVRARS